MEAFSASRIFFINDFFLELTYRHRKQIKANENATVQTRAIATALQALNSVGEQDKKMSWEWVMTFDKKKKYLHLDSTRVHALKGSKFDADEPPVSD